ncbi:PAS domain-containing protein [uncultured Caulobacter sp.]|uniref:PAS domain-containing protein n=1 Tax=uncultured Caulobacter sp. TaxID=158749 RepID=UPI002602755B|nr:PAS domain-containing protein [uncultured Caulobacter sp.]
MLDHLVKIYADSDIAVIVTDANFSDEGPTILFANAAAQRMTGYARAEMVGRSPRMLQGAETSLASRKALARAIRQNDHSAVVLRNYRKNGEPYDCAISVEVLRNRAGAPELAIAFEQERPIRAGRRRAV